VGCYTPNILTVKVGHIVTMTNTDSTGIHTFTSGTVDGFAPSPDGIFDSGMLMQPGDSFEYNADTVGEFPFFCTLHVWMQGVLIVQEAEEPEPTPEPEPEVSISAKTNYRSYTNLDVVKISGTVSPVVEHKDVTWIVISPEGETVGMGQITPNSDGTFSDSFVAGGNLWKSSGDYIIQLSYVGATTKINIKFIGVNLPEPTPDPTPTYDTTPPKILKPTDITVDAENNNGAIVTYDVLAIDETDQIVRPSCSPSSGSFFSIGTTKVTCNASDSSGNRAQSVSFSITVNLPQLLIPNWIKNIAEFWCENKIDDASFIEGIQYLIDNNIIIVSASSGSGSTQEIPNWVKNNACWWSEGLITSEDFASGIEYLVREGIIRV